MRLQFRLLLVIAAVAVVLTSISLYSLPRLAAEHATPCVSCHINPNGGGMRNEFGNFAVAYNERCLQATKEWLGPNKLRPRLSDNVTFGLDYRALYIESGRTLQMQADLYLAVELLKHVSYNLTLGQSNVRDSYLLLKFKDEHYWIKAGRFYPAFGLRDPDHNAYVRTVPLLAPELTVDGLSIGGNFLNGSNITLEFYAQEGQRVLTFHSFRAGAVGPVGFLTGVSWRQSEELPDGYRFNPIAKSAFGGLSYGRLTALGEVGAVGKGNEQRTAYGQLAARIMYGLHVLAEYNFHDPDWHVKSGTNEFWRLSIECFPIPFVEVRPAATIIGAGPRKNQVDYFIQFHVTY
ncbi:MAG: hypothetical protein IT585_09855 [candidate division Zixibacteria bacterium]|nr:hypothetical protein [candidate division Zixibacteria bacterium]